MKEIENKRERKRPEAGQMTHLDMLMRFLDGSKAMFFVSIAASGIVAGLELVPPQIIRIVVDYCLGESVDSLPGWLVSALESAGGRTFVLEHLYLAAVAVVVTALLTAIFRYLQNYLNSRADQKMVKTARDLLYEHICRLPYSWHMQNQTGDIIQRCTSDVTEVQTFVSEQLVQVIRIVILIVFSAGVMLAMNWKMSIVVLLSIPVITGYSWFFYEKVGEQFLACDENEGVLSTICQENLTGVRVVKAFGRENYERERFEKQNHVYTDIWMKLCALLAGFWASGDLVMSTQLMLLVVIGTVFCVNGQMTAGELVAFLSYNQMLTWPVRRLGRMISEMSKAGVSMDRLLYILNSPMEDMEIPEGASAEGKLPAMDGDIEFSHVDFAYTDTKILQDVSLKIQGGTTLGILGGTGSGKSTLVQLLDRLYEPGAGTITVDGVPLAEIPKPWARAHIGIVLQEPYLFSGTLEENISIAREAPHEEVENAVKIASLSESIEHFKDGYDTVVGERGVTLSGGQKQRTAIARTVLLDTPILILDDSLSAVDTATDEKIRRELEKFKGKKTIILISHRISTLMGADQIIVLEHGQITQRGTHAELSAEPGLYQTICRIQDMPEELMEEGGADCE